MDKAEKILHDWQHQALKTKALAFYQPLINRYPKAGVYLVGGMVRDLLLGRETKDFDFVITKVGEKALITFLKKYGRVNLVGKMFGVIKFTPPSIREDEAIDIALPRLDKPGKGTGAYRDVTIVRRATLSILDDLVRRDYTVNAIAWSLTEKKLIDPANGISDLKKKLLRTVGESAQRFQEDYSRLLRGLRFSVVLGFGFAPQTWTSLKSLTKKLNAKVDDEFVVPREVIARELLKTFLVDPVAALTMYDKSGALSVLIPEIEATKRCPQPRRFHTEGSVWKHTILALSALRSRAYRRWITEEPDAELVVTVLLHDLAKPTMLRTPSTNKVDRVRFDGHDVVGGKMARAIAERLKLASPAVASGLHVDPANLEWLIGHHLILLHARPSEMKLTTIERYFVSHPLAHKLKALLLADTLGIIPADGRSYTKHLVELEAVLKKLCSTRSHKLPSPLLGGEEIMAYLKIGSGPKVGFLKRKLREEQLLGSVKTKAAAKRFLKNLHGKTNL